MEAIQNRHSCSNINLSSDASLRMSSRPLMATAVPPGQGRAHDDFGNDLAPPRTTWSSERRVAKSGTRKLPSIEVFDEEEDEMDCLSQESKGSPDAVTRFNPNDGVLLEDGTFTEFHPDFKPRKLPSFKKTKSKEDATELGPSSSNPVATGTKASKMRRRSPTPVDKRASSSKIPPSKTRPMSPPKAAADKTPRPKPRPVRKPQPFPLAETQSNSEVLSPMSNKILPRKESIRKESDSHSKITPKPFPIHVPNSSIVSPPAPPKAKPYPMARAANSATLPGASLKRRNIRQIAASESEEEPTSSIPSAQPFPMNVQLYNSSQTTPRSKRCLEDGSGSSRKKRKQGYQNGLSPTSLMLDEPSVIDECDLLFLDPSVDPSTLCPWCDEPLPPKATPHLQSLIKSVRAQSYKSARPTNPMGLKASVGAYVTVCKRHRFESHQIPLAKARGWPVSIDFHKLKPRVEALRNHLQALISNKPLAQPPDDWSMDDTDDEILPRSGSLFWQELVGDIRAKGTRAIASAKGQFANFDKLQPGYYGELGYIIIYQTIYNLFPPTEIDPISVLPLTPQEFIQRILVPEVAVELIIKDMGQTRDLAIKTLRESVEYGVAMFPDTGTGEGGEAAEKMMKERAFARRKELQEEEALEDEMTRLKVKKKQGKKAEAERSSFVAPPSSPAHSDKPSRPKPKPRKKQTGVEEDGVEVGEIMGPSLRKTKKREKQDDGYDTTSTVASNARSPKRGDRSLALSDSEVEVVSDGPVVPKRKQVKSKAVLTDLDVDFMDPGPPRKLSRAPSITADWLQDNDATPRPTKGKTISLQKGSKPLEQVRRLRLTSSIHSQTISSPQQNFADLMGSDD